MVVESQGWILSGWGGVCGAVRGAISEDRCRKGLRRLG